jgi:hypothetical protein
MKKVKEKDLILSSLAIFFVISVALMFTFSPNSRLLAWGLTGVVVAAVLAFDFVAVAGRR